MRLVLRNRIFLALDLLGWVLIPVLALAIRLDGLEAVGTYSVPVLAFTAVAIICKLPAFWVAGLYRRYWLYASITELAVIVFTVAAAGLAAWLVYGVLVGPLLQPGVPLPRSVPLLDLLLTAFYSGGIRYVPRLFAHLRDWPRGMTQHRALIAGAGDAGAMVVRELRANPQLEIESVGFLDDDPAKLGSTIHGLQVLGTISRLVDVARAYNVTEVIIAMPTAPGSIIREIQDTCQQARIEVKTIPGVYDLISGRVVASQLRHVQIEDLLRRKPVEIDERAVSEIVRGSSVLVTGAGGSIGSEICRQVARLGCSEVILLGHGENTIFDVHNELKTKHPWMSVVPVIGDIRNEARMRRVFDTYRPQTVFHAAAHKHVPLMELNPEEAVTNNVQGTASVLAAAEAHGVSRFVFISTDKAVNPVNVMGATKLLAEMLVHQAAVRIGAPYVSVRFGNVLASRGSVVPLFQAQIAAGGPITITHSEMTRYFMTIPEAVQLVLQAAALGKGGETFVLDMGEPVRIVDLARDLVQLSGLQLGRDIEVQFTGLRPGEKLYEELFSSAEQFRRTEHEKLFVVRNRRSPERLEARVRDLLAAATAGDGLRVRQQLVELVPAYGSERPSSVPEVAHDTPREGQRAPQTGS